MAFEFPIRSAGSPLPVPYRLLGKAHLSIVMRQQLGLGLDEIGKLCGQHLGNVLVVLLPSVAE
jgi:hypothetical protein